VAGSLLDIEASQVCVSGGHSILGGGGPRCAAYDCGVTGQLLAIRVEAALRDGGDPGRAEQEKRYLKSELEHVGASVPTIRRIVKAELAAHGPLKHDEFIDLVSALWARQIHECRMAAVEPLELRDDVLRASDIELIERLLRQSGTWALVDGLAASVVGNLVERYPELSETLDRWSSDEDFWIRRSALLALLRPLREGQGDFERFGRYADAMLEDREFFIRKAIGWVLRDTSRKRPDLVFEWLAPRAARASGVTIREAQKHLSATQQGEIAGARSLRPK
jgi:3-methyladenine DNA glycosylase AlkD